VAAATALETLAVLRDEDVPASPGWARVAGAVILAGEPFVAGRGRGLMTAWSCDLTGAPRKAWSTVVRALQSGLLLLPAGIHGEVVQVTPPVVLTPAQIDRYGAGACRRAGRG
jgi:4-aminobutyrate aminotransferase-like enzyme